MSDDRLFQPLFEQFPAVIEQMPDVFTSHQFILALAHKNQAAYIEALYAHRDSSPFGRVHRALSQHLSELPQLVVRLRVDAPSVDIFGHKNKCPEWKKVALVAKKPAPAAPDRSANKDSRSKTIRKQAQ